MIIRGNKRRRLINKIAKIDKSAAEYFLAHARQEAVRVSQGFAWDRTPQGWLYWSGISLRVDR